MNFSSIFLLMATSPVFNSQPVEQDCKQSTLDCARCITNGCAYCPGDGSCSVVGEIGSESRLSKSQCQVSDLVLQKSDGPDASEVCSTSSLYQSKWDGSDSSTPFFSDPLYSAQGWIFKMINILPVWQKNITGAGIRVRINDSGVDADHPEFAGRFEPESSCDEFLPIPKGERRSLFPRWHGTAVASIVGAGGNNGNCGVGIAPNVLLSSCTAIYNPAFLLNQRVDAFDISQNSFNQGTCIEFDRRLADGDQCPFVYDVGYSKEDLDSKFPCNVCDFSTTLTDICERSIIDHCKLFRDEGEGRACFEFLELFVSDGTTCLFHGGHERYKSILEQGIVEGRGGKGAIYVVSSGNGALLGDDSNFSSFVSSRFAMSVGAVAQDGRRAGYSVAGASIFVSAPGGGDLNDVGFIATYPGNRCRAVERGTSYASPVVSGVIALVLETNPNLTWRDVFGILAATSRIPTIQEIGGDTSKIDTAEHGTGGRPDDYPADVVTNAAGFSHSNGYGFGIVDALAAVTAAENWELFEPERMVLVSSDDKINKIIADDPNLPTESSLEVESGDAGEGFQIETIILYLCLSHPSRGKLRITLKSPHRTESVLTPGNRNENSSTHLWRLTTVRCWGESPVGTWQLSITNVGEELVSGKLIQWRLAIYGRGGGVAPFTFARPPSPPSIAPSVSPTPGSSVTENDFSGSKDLRRTPLRIRFAVAGTIFGALLFG